MIDYTTSKSRSITGSIITILIGFGVFVVLYKFFDFWSFASIVGFVMGILSSIVVLIASMKFNDRNISRIINKDKDKRKDIGNKGAQLIRILVIPPVMICIFAAYYQSSNGTMEIILGYLSSFLVGLGINIFLSMIFKPHRYV